MLDLDDPNLWNRTQLVAEVLALRERVAGVEVEKDCSLDTLREQLKAAQTEADDLMVLVVSVADHIGVSVDDENWKKELVEEAEKVADEAWRYRQLKEE